MTANAAGPAQASVNVELRGDNRVFFGSKEHEVILSGPAECVAGDTVIEGDGRTIAWLAEHGVAPVVQTLQGPVQAEVPFLKGMAQLYEVRLSNGQSFKATAFHFVLTAAGDYVPVASLLLGQSLLAYGIAPKASIEEHGLLVHALDGLNYLGKAQDCQDDYSACSCPCGEQPRPPSSNGLSFAPSRSDAPLQGHGCHEKDVTALTARHSRLCQCACHLSNGYSVHHWYLGLEPMQEYSFLSSAPAGLSLYNITSAVVASVSKANVNNFYDLTVPGAHHYFAQGAIHHNTGKTYGGMWKLHAACWTIPKTQVALVRKNYNALHGTVVKTLQRVQAGFPGIREYGGETPQRFIYPNGSCIWLGGMDNPEACLSAERDLIYCNQSEELTLNDWELLMTRCTGRGAVIAHPQMLGDCNPSGTKHWIRERAKTGKLRLLVAKHIDNPSLYTADGKITEQGQRSLTILGNLTGVRRKRLLEGIWATAEGAVYEMFDPAIHVCVRDPKEMVSWYLAMDEGYTNPAAILLVGADSDRRWHVFREYYKVKQLEADVVIEAAQWYREEGNLCECAAVDEAAAGLIAALKKAGVNAIAGKGRVLDGILAIQNRLKVQPDGRPRLTLDPSCKETKNEFESYMWKFDKDGKGKDVPVDDFNHAVGALRYLEDVLRTGTGSFGNASSVHIPDQRGGRAITVRQFTPRQY